MTSFGYLYINTHVSHETVLLYYRIDKQIIKQIKTLFHIKFVYLNA